MSEWKGEERRAPEGVIIAVMNHVQETLEAHTARMDGKFDKVNLRIDSLIQSITAYMDKQEAIENAFIKNKEGKPDYHGHFYDHDHRKKISEWWRSVGEKAFIKFIEWASVAFFTWMLYTLWQAFLRGPA